MRSYTASPGRYTNTGRRAVLVSLFGPSYLTVICSLFLVRQWQSSVGTETGTHSAYCACFERFHRCSSWTRCARTSLCNDRCRLVWTSLLLRRGSSPWSICSCSWCSSRTRFLVSFTVPLNGWTIAAAATVVISCCSSADTCCGSVCVAMSCGGGFTPGGAYVSVCDSVKPIVFSTKKTLGCMHAEFLVQQQ